MYVQAFRKTGLCTYRAVEKLDNWNGQNFVLTSWFLKENSVEVEAVTDFPPQRF
jgi:hypothetical protein